MPGIPYAQPPAGSSQPQTQPPSVLGLPACTQPQQGERPPLRQVAPLPPQHGAELPSAMEEWHAAAVIMFVWLAVSLPSVAIGLRFSLPLFSVPGACGAIGAIIYRFHSCSSRAVTAASLGRTVKPIRMLAEVAAPVSAGFGFLFFAVFLKK